LLRLVLIAAE
jgi:hypothetical protein